MVLRGRLTPKRLWKLLEQVRAETGRDIHLRQTYTGYRVMNHDEIQLRRLFALYDDNRDLMGFAWPCRYLWMVLEGMLLVSDGWVQMDIRVRDDG